VHLSERECVGGRRRIITLEAGVIAHDLKLAWQLEPATEFLGSFEVRIGGESIFGLGMHDISIYI